MAGAVIVAGVDGSAAATVAVRWAASEAATRGVALRLVHGFQLLIGMYSGGTPVSLSAIAGLRADADALLAAARDEALATRPELDVTTTLAQQHPVAGLLAAAADARMLVVGAPDPDWFAGVLAGSTAAGVAAHARIPVAVVRGPRAEAPEGGPVIVGVDGSPPSDQAVALAFDEAARRSAFLIAIHCWNDAEYAAFPPYGHGLAERAALEAEQDRFLAERLAGSRERYPQVRVTRMVVPDRPRHQLLDWSDRAQLMVIGSRGRGGFRGLPLGSTSQALIGHAGCPVLLTSAMDSER